MKKIIVSICILLLAGTGWAMGNNVELTDFLLAGDLAGDGAAFTLTALAHMDNSTGGTLKLISGPLALTAFEAHPGEHIFTGENEFSLQFDRRGVYPVKVQFTARVRQEEDSRKVDFAVAPSVLEAVALRGLAADTQVQFAGGARPERRNGDFLSYLPADGTVKISWKEAAPETEGKLFFSTEMLAQVSVAPGLMREAALLSFKVMQGELSRVSLLLHGEGEVTRVQGDQVLAWSVEPVTNSPDRRLIIQLNQPQKDQFSCQVQAQTPLGAFPQTADVLQVRPENATRFAGYIRLVNEGAVRLEVLQSGGTSQISPDQFPQNDATRAFFRGEGNQRFAYRFAGTDFSLRIQADQILPEVAASETASYHLADNELAIDAEFELDIREAPLRELLIEVPRGYSIARILAAGMSDYFLTEPPGSSNAELRIVYGQPISDRQLVDLRLEHNQGLAGTDWDLPRLNLPQAKSLRGFVGAAADAGFRLTPDRTRGLTELATAFYPVRLDGIQAAFRLSDSAWEASLRVERLPQTVQASALHLFSIGEGIAYGSSVINYAVSGAPVSSFKVDLSDEFYNVEFTGKDIRNWHKVDGAYVVQLQTPVSGAYTLLATYERPFKARGETLSFDGARPLDAQSEEGYTIVTSAYQFEVKPADISPGLLPLETGEVPPEYRLFFDAPVLAAYRYSARPFHLNLSLNPLAQEDSLHQIVDRACLNTRVSKEGQVLTDVRYFIKNRGTPDFRLTIPNGWQLWSATINGATVVPVQDGAASLIPLPQKNDPDAVVELDLKLAAQSADPSRVNIAAPTADAPVMLAEWKIDPDAGRRLVCDKSSVMPVGGAADASGFGQIQRLFARPNLAGSLPWFIGALGVALGAAAVWRRAASAGIYRGGAACVLVLACVVLLCFAKLSQLADGLAVNPSPGLTFLAPVQQAGTTWSVTVSNIADKVTFSTILQCGWPALLAAVLLWAGRSFAPAACRIAAWTMAGWAALRFPNGAPAFLWILFFYLTWRIVLPVLAQLGRLPRKAEAPPMPDSSGTAPAALALMIGGLWWFGGSPRALAAESPVVPDSVTQTIRVEDKFVLGSVKIHWQAAKGQILPVLADPAVLTRISYPEKSMEILSGPAGCKYRLQLEARYAGAFDIEAQYQMPVTDAKSEAGLSLPSPYGLINKIHITVENQDVDVLSPQAVSIHRDRAGSNTVASLVLPPGPGWIGWRPRLRDVRHEKPVFYAEISQLFAPLAGVIEGVQAVSIRPAQGELSELILNVPPGATITDVSASGSLVSLWRFDPDVRKLRVTLNPAQSRPFIFSVHSQISSGALPYEQSAGLISVENAAGQIGLAGVATGNEVELDSVQPMGLSPINLEDFPGEALAVLKTRLGELTLRRAFRYSDTNATLALRAAAVQPDVRVETDDTLSLGEDRTVLADSFKVNITRAGIFELSFLLPAGFAVESISSPALSQWTELKTGGGSVITLHLNGKTLGQQQFTLTLTGPGVKTARDWAVPQIVLREAGKQWGSLLIVPEQGMRLQVVKREGYTQLDPGKSGITQKGVLGFRVLQVPSALSLDIEQVEPWIQVNSLQNASVTEGQVKVTANLQYQIENTGLKNLHVLLPTNAEGVRFQGDQVEDFASMKSAATNGMQWWEIKLERRVIGPYFLQVDYQLALPGQSAPLILRGVEAGEVNLQRGFVTVQSDPRLQVTALAPPESLQPSEWEGIPRQLRKDLQAAAASLTYRLLAPAFELPLKLQRHEAAKLLPARVNNITFNSVISDDGVMLTGTRLEIHPGDKRLLNLTLPRGAQFWFAFVNDNAVWPWRDGDKILIPIGQQDTGEKPVVVEFFHSGQAGRGGAHSLDLSFVAPKFDLPLENITWNLSMGDKWQVQHWAGAFQLQKQEATSQLTIVDTNAYMENVNNLRQARTAEAGEVLNSANYFLSNGDPWRARRAFEEAYGLSTQDPAFNEDARVQLHNMKLQEALIGLNESQSAANGDPGALGGKLRELRGRKDMNYTQQDAKDIIDINSAEENATFMRLAEKLIQQQDAVVVNPTGIRATIPKQGRLLTFTRSVAVEPWANLNISLEASAARAASLVSRVLVLAAALAIFAIFGLSKGGLRNAA